MDIVEFLEARVAEEEAALLDAQRRDWTLTPTLALRLLAECAQKRQVINAWKQAAASEALSDPAEARGMLSIARRAVMLILAAAYRGHPDHSEDWHR